MASTNLLIALANLVVNPCTKILTNSSSSNRMNSVGESLEFYVKDLFCGSLDIVNAAKKHELYSQKFSYLGNQNNPPDFIIQDGDAIEVKKINVSGKGGSLALNSSHPKDKLHVNDKRIKLHLKNEAWEEKDMIYVVGSMNGSSLRSLWFVHGECYAANKDVYERIAQKIEAGISTLGSDIELSETNELARVNRVDPLGITNLRVRGMWQIEHPGAVFDYLEGLQTGSAFNMNALLLKEKYDAYPKEDRKHLEQLVGACLMISDVKIKSPNNPAVYLDAKLITFYQ